jgi:outer membrane protein TolC
MALEIELTVRRANLQASDAREQLEVAKRAVMQAEESLREIEVRYKEQTATITQRIDAQVALSNARVRRSGAQADVEVARRWNRPWVA